MCLIAFDWQPSRPTRLRLIANRDEFYQRPSAPLAWWSDQPDILAGRDLSAGGTWLGVHRRGRVAAVTNVREPHRALGERSRGELVTEFLHSDHGALAFAEQLLARGDQYSGFNVLLFEPNQAVYCSNRISEVQPLSSGVYGLSNAALDTPWPKLLATKAAMQQRLEWSALQQVMQNTACYPESDLPCTGVGTARERLLSSAFIVSEDYGTRVISEVEWASDHLRVQEQQFERGQWRETRQERFELG